MSFKQGPNVTRTVTEAGTQSQVSWGMRQRLQMAQAPVALLPKIWNLWPMSIFKEQIPEDFNGRKRIKNLIFQSRAKNKEKR